MSEIYAALDGAHGAELVEDPDRLAAHLAAWLTDPDSCAEVAKAGHRVVEKLGGALDRTLASLDPYLMQLQLHERARHA
jgi:3-deoxy-D-manno-octulosonic-acid transferase